MPQRNPAGLDTIVSNVWPQTIELADQLASQMFDSRLFVGRLSLEYYREILHPHREPRTIPGLAEIETLYDAPLSTAYRELPGVDWRFERGTSEWLSTVQVEGQRNFPATKVRHILGYTLPKMINMPIGALQHIADACSVDSMYSKRN